MTGLKRQSLSPDEQIWLKRLQTIAPRVATWLNQDTTLPKVHPSSSLYADGMGWMVQPSYLAEYHITISAEHLHLCLQTLLGKEAVLYPTAQITMGRTAYTSALNAVWLLYPSNRCERRRRAWLLKDKEIQEQRSALRDLHGTSIEPKLLTEAHATLDKKQEELDRANKEYDLGLDRSKRDDRFNQTRAIREATNQVYDGQTDEDVRVAVTNLWRTSSAVAHGFYHHALSRMTNLDGGEELPSVGELGLLQPKLDQDLGPLLCASYMFLERAITRYRLRAVAAHS